jgi:F5/8 type C domain
LPLEIPAVVPASAVILEVPVGVYEDATAMYHATFHRRPILNGLSGYDPPHYAVVRVALQDKWPNAVLPLTAYADIAIFVPLAAAPEWVPLIESQTEAVRIATTSTHEVLLLRRSASEHLAPRAASAELSIRGMASNLYPENLDRMLDNDRFSAWSTENPQIGGEEFTIDLGEAADVDGVRLSLGAHLTGFPRLLVIETSLDGNEWTDAWRGGAARAAVVGTLQDVRQAPMWFPLGERRARYLRFKQLGRSEVGESGWVVAELRVFGSAAKGPA